MSDPVQFESFMRDYQDMVYTTALRLLGNESEAQDIAQEVFIRAYAHFEDLSQSKTAGGWLKTVARNLSLNHLTRYRSRWRFFSEFAHEGSEDDRSFESELVAPDTHSQIVGDADRREVLEEALQKLPEAQRVPLVLYHFENMSYEEIAGQLKVSLGKVKTDIHRAREVLKKRLAGCLEEIVC